jgi:acetolactate synthase regulatory subunit
MSFDSFSLNILAHHQTTILERLLQVIRYRGYHLKSLSVCSQQKKTLKIQLSIHCIEASETKQKDEIKKLFHQLNKLWDIQSIRVSCFGSAFNIDVS